MHTSMNNFPISVQEFLRPPKCKILGSAQTCDSNHFKESQHPEDEPLYVGFEWDMIQEKSGTCIFYAIYEQVFMFILIVL